MNQFPLVLQLDAAGNPNNWITHERSAYYYAKRLIAWEAAPVDFILHGGISAITGRQSTMTINTIVAIKGKITERQQRRLNRVPLNNKTLFRRDCNLCAYCGNVFPQNDLSRDHIVPMSRGGRNIWTNVVAGCTNCNKRKDNRTLDEVGLQLLYVPYVPNRSEYLILQNRQILADQMKFLLAKVPLESRIRSWS